MRSDRTANLLIAHLDALARAARRIPHAETERRIELAGAATRHAVALQLLDPDRAAGIWRDIHARYPDLPRVDIDLLPRLAA
jgi:hypothetical protein